MIFEWDETKRQKNIEKHKLDFEDVDLVFEKDFVVFPAKENLGEKRFLAVGRLRGFYVTIVYTMREGPAYRIISFRRARDEEKRRYQTLHG